MSVGHGPSESAAVMLQPSQCRRDLMLEERDDGEEGLERDELKRMSASACLLGDLGRWLERLG